MLADRRVHAVDICVPNDLHRSYVERAANAGKHVLCEKPIAMTLEDGQAMVESTRRAGVIFMVAHVLRFWPEYVRAREILLSRRLGDCRAITMRRMLSLLISVQGEQNWRQQVDRMGGAIIDLQIHDLDFLNWTFGMPESVFCAAIPSRGGGFDHCYTVLSYASGIKALVESSYLLQGDPMVFSMKAVCDEGTLDYVFHPDRFDMHELAGHEAGVAAESNPGSLMCYRAGREPEVIVRQDPDLIGLVFSREVSHFVNGIRRGEPDLIAPATEAVSALQVGLACRESALTGRSIRIDAAVSR
jgi:predicted dehydrogenase